MITWYELGTAPTYDVPPLPDFLDRKKTPRKPWSPSSNPTEIALKKSHPEYKISHPDAPVEVAQIKLGEWNILKNFANMKEFDAWYHPAYHLIRQCNGNAESTIFLIELINGGQLDPDKTAAARVAVKAATAQGGEGVERPVKAPRQPGRGGSKTLIIAQLLLRPTGCTTADVLAATGWPSVSMPAQAKAAGLTLRKEKAGKVTTYYGAK